MKLPPEQQAIRVKAFHPSGTFVEFPEADAEKSIPERFEKIAQQYPDRTAVKTRLNRSPTMNSMGAPIVWPRTVSAARLGSRAVTYLGERATSSSLTWPC
jgi:hypothetical protein